MALTNEQRERVWARYQEIRSTRNDPIPVLKAALRQAVDAIDTWVESMRSDLRASLPAAVRTALTDDDLELLSTLVADERRPGNGRGAASPGNGRE